MGMGLGDQLKVTLFGESHGKCIGALVEGIPPGTEIDLQTLRFPAIGLCRADARLQPGLEVPSIAVE